MKLLAVCLASFIATPMAAQSAHEVTLGVLAEELGFDLNQPTIREMRQTLRGAGYVQTEERYDPTIAPFYEIWQTDDARPYDHIVVTACQSDMTVTEQLSTKGNITLEASTYAPLRESLFESGLLQDAETTPRKPVNSKLVETASQPVIAPKAHAYGALRWIDLYISQLQQDADAPVYHFTEIWAGYQCPPLY